ncbi:hypothetical protein XPU_0622, partial [Xanthomonas arboricola pv. pruni str. MAFF 311562]
GARALEPALPARARAGSGGVRLRRQTAALNWEA